MWRRRRTSEPSAAKGGTVSIVSWAAVGRVRKEKSETRREERESSQCSDFCVAMGKWCPGSRAGLFIPQAWCVFILCRVCVYVVCVCACVCMYVCVCVSYRFNISSMTPITSATLGSVFPLLPQLSPGEASWEMPLPAPCKDPPCSLLTLPHSGSCMTPGAPASTLSISLLVCLPPHRARAL